MDGMAEQKAGCSRGAGTLRAAALLRLTMAAALICLGLEHHWLTLCPGINLANVLHDGKPRLQSLCWARLNRD